MQDSNINFDDFFRARLANQEAAVAPDMFDRIMHARKRQRKPLFWWSLSTPQKVLLGGVLLLSSTFLGWKYFMQQNIYENKLQSNEENISSNMPQSSPPNHTKTPITIESKENVSARKNDFAERKLLEKTTPSVSARKNDFAERKLLEKNNPSVSAQKNDFAERKLLEKTTPSVSARKNDFAERKLLEKNNPSVSTLKSDFSSVESATQLPKSNKVEGTTPNTQNVENQAKNVGLTLEKLEKTVDFDFLNTKKLLPLANLSFQTPDNMQGVLDDGCKSFNKKKKTLPKPSNWFFDVYGSPDYAIRRLQNVSGDFQNYIQVRDSTEAQWYAFSAGARLSRVFSSSIAVRVGLHYSQINEIFDYKQHDFTRITRTTVEIRDVSGALLRVDTLEKVEIGVRQRTDYNRYRSIDLPLQIGYEMGNKAITWSGNLGLNLNLYSWQSGKLLNTNLEPTEVENSQAFRTQVGLSAFASVGCYINMSRNWQFLIEPNIRYQIGSWTRNNYPLRQDYTTLGLFTGVRYRLERKKRFFF